VYVCAQDRESTGSDSGASINVSPGVGTGTGTGTDESAVDTAGERLLCLVNAPAQADRRTLTSSEISACETTAFQRLQRCGLVLEALAPMQRTTPTDFAELFPGTGGALYGPASHGWQASFSRLGARHPLPGLYLAGGSTHPGPGVPMATLSGRQAARAVEQDLASTWHSHAMAMPGGISTP
jgi:1-hydroxycarotenoid 3,4-desaturase